MSLAVEEGWRGSFDRARWAIVPEKSARLEILSNIQDAKDNIDMWGVSGRKRAWPPFKDVSTILLINALYCLTMFQVYHKSNGIYQYHVINIRMKTGIPIYDDENGEQELVDINSDSPLLTLRSHLHPLHVIINAHQKFATWDPFPTDEPTLEVINNISDIWEVWHSVPPTDDFLQYPHGDETDHSGLGPPPETRTRSNHSGSSLGKRSKRDDDDLGDERHIDPHRYDGTSHVHHPPEDDIPELEESHFSREPSIDSFDMEYAKSIQAWQGGILCSRTFSPSGDLGDEDEVVGSLEAAGYNGWKPIWD
jgi:hypothetical protein